MEINCPLCNKLMIELTRKESFVAFRGKRQREITIDFEYVECTSCGEKFTTYSMDESNGNKIKNEIRDQKIKEMLKKSL